MAPFREPGARDGTANPGIAGNMNVDDFQSLGFGNLREQAVGWDRDALQDAVPDASQSLPVRTSWVRPWPTAVSCGTSARAMN